MARRAAFALFVLTVSLLSYRLQAQSKRHLRPAAERRERAAQLAHLRRRLFQPSLQSSDADHAGEREEPGSRVGVSVAADRKLAGHAAGGRRDHVPDAAAQRRRRARRRNRTRLLDVPLSQRTRPRRLLRLEQSRRRDPWRNALHGHARRAPDRARRAEAAGRSGKRRSPTAKPAIPSRCRRSSSKTRSSSAWAAANTAFAASLPRMTRKPAKRRGVSTRFPDLENLDMKRGNSARPTARVTAILKRGNTAADRCG